MLQITELPEVLQEWLSNDDKSGAILNDLRTKHGLTDQQSNGLGWLIYHIFIKDVAPEKFIFYLAEELNFNEDLAKKIANELMPILSTMGSDLRQMGVDIRKIVPDYIAKSSANLYTSNQPPAVKNELNEEEGSATDTDEASLETILVRRSAEPEMTHRPVKKEPDQPGEEPIILYKNKP